MFFLVGYMSLIATISRNFCGLDWMRSNPGGLKSEFDAYFKSLSAEQLKVRLLMFSARSLVYLTNITAQVWKDMEAQAKSAAVSVPKYLGCLVY
jgi:hypothetical protein